MQVSDESYWQLISEGDKKVYEQVFKTYYALLCRFAVTLMKDKDEAEEAVQTVFYNLWNKRESLLVNLSMKSYLYRAVHNECMNRIKHQKVKQAYASDYLKSGSNQHNGLAQLEAKELSKKIAEAIDKLPEQCGVVFKMSRFQQLKYSEIAEHLDISVKTVENHMGKALRLMRGYLKDFLPFVVGIIMMWIVRK